MFYKYKSCLVPARFCLTLGGFKYWLLYMTKLKDKEWEKLPLLLTAGEPVSIVLTLCPVSLQIRKIVVTSEKLKRISGNSLDGSSTVFECRSLIWFLCVLYHSVLSSMTTYQYPVRECQTTQRWSFQKIATYSYWGLTKFPTKEEDESLCVDMELDAICNPRSRIFQEKIGSWYVCMEMCPDAVGCSPAFKDCNQEFHSKSIINRVV